MILPAQLEKHNMNLSSKLENILNRYNPEDDTGKITRAIADTASTVMFLIVKIKQLEKRIEELEKNNE